MNGVSLRWSSSMNTFTKLATARWLISNPQNTCCRSRAAFSFWSSTTNGNGLQKAISDAEKLVGYPTTYNSLKYIIDDEEQPANILGLAKKIVGSGHPLLSTARDLLSQEPHAGHNLGGLWVLLLSKAAGARSKLTLESELVNGIHPKQRALAETTELINTAFLIHQSMVEIQSTIPTSKESNNSTLNFGNKLSVLGGDFLLAKASMELGKLENTEVVELISRALGHLSEGSIVVALQSSDKPLTLQEWEEHVFLLKGSLLANSCEAAVILLEHDRTIRSKAFEFGRNLALAQQCARDVEEFHSKKKLLSRTNYLLLSALENSYELRHDYDNYASHAVSVSTSTELRKAILRQLPNIEASVKSACEKNYVKVCEDSLEVFPKKTSVEAIKKILRTVCE